MEWIATGVSRWLWGHMLWFMRRPWMKDLQRRSTRMFGPRFEERAWQHLTGQNRIARRYGLGLLRISVMLFIGSVMITLTYFGALYLYETGVLTAPQSNAGTVLG